MDERIDRLKKQINTQTEKREERLNEADSAIEQVIDELKSLRKNFYFVSLKGLDRYLIKTMTLEFNLPDEAAWQTIIIAFDYDGIKMYKKNAVGARTPVYDSLLEIPWLENAARAKVYNFVRKFPDNWKELLNEYYKEAVMEKLENTLHALKETAVYCLEVDEYHMKKRDRDEKKNKVYINNDSLRKENITQILAEKCCSEGKEPIIVQADSLYILDEKRNPIHVKPEEIERGMYLYEQYMRYGLNDDSEPMLRGLSYVEERYFCVDNIVVVSRNYIISNIDFTDEYEKEKSLK